MKTSSLLRRIVSTALDVGAARANVYVSKQRQEAKDIYRRAEKFIARCSKESAEQGEFSRQDEADEIVKLSLLEGVKLGWQIGGLSGFLLQLSVGQKLGIPILPGCVFLGMVGAGGGTICGATDDFRYSSIAKNMSKYPTTSKTLAAATLFSAFLLGYSSNDKKNDEKKEEKAHNTPAFRK